MLRSKKPTRFWKPATRRLQRRFLPPSCRRIAKTSRRLAGLAKCYLANGDLVRAEQTLALAPPDKRDAQPIAGVRAALDLAKRGQNAGNLGELKAKVAANPADHAARIELATAMAAAGDKEAAVARAARKFSSRPQLERAGGEKAARAAFRGVGTQGCGDPRRPQASVLAPVLLSLLREAKPVPSVHRYRRVEEMPPVIPVFPAARLHSVAARFAAIADF